MGKPSSNEVDKALQEHLKALDEYNQLIGARERVPGQKIVSEKWNKESFRKLDKAKAKVVETYESWKRLRGF